MIAEITWIHWAAFILAVILFLALDLGVFHRKAHSVKFKEALLDYQHRVLFWGVLGALVMRGIMIGAGAALVRQFEWTLILFGGFLVFSGIKLLLTNEESVEPEKNILMRLARKFLPVSASYDKHHFITRVNGRHMLTPLFLVLIMVETTDVIFALDSIPAIFGITTKEYIVFTSIGVSLVSRWIQDNKQLEDKEVSCTKIN